MFFVEFALNNHASESTKSSPFLLNYGKNPRIGSESTRKPKIAAAEEFTKTMKIAWEEAEATLLKAKDDMKRFADRRHSEAPEYKTGDWVWFSLKNITTNQPSKKLGNKCDGPFEVIEIISPNAIQIWLLIRLQLSTNIINVSQLSRFKP